jgi:hypothetical protein
LGRKGNQDHFTLPPSEQVKKYNSTLDDSDFIPFDPDLLEAYPLQLDMFGTASSAWNKKCALLFAEAYVQLDDAESRDVDVVQQAAITYFKALKRQWDHIQANLTPSARAAMVKKDIEVTKRSRRLEVCIYIHQFSFLINSRSF